MSEHVTDRLSAFLDAELPAREQEAVAGHLRDCAACASHLDRLRSIDLEAQVLPLSVPDGYFDTLPSRIRGRLEKAPRPVARRLPVWTWAVAAASLISVVAPLTLRQNPLATLKPAAAPVPTATYPAPAMAEPDAGLRDRLASEVPADTGVPERGGKDDLMGSAPKLRESASRTDRHAAAPPPIASAPREAPSQPEADELGYAQGAAQESVAPRVQLRRPGPGGPYSQQQVPLQAPPLAEAKPEAPAPAVAPPAGERRAESSEAPRDEELAKRENQAARQQGVGGVLASGRLSSAVGSSDEKVFRLLQGATAPTTLAALRERREAWRSFTRDFPSSARVDEARVRVVETGAEAWRVGGEPADLVQAQEDAKSYLARRDAAQAPRVRALLEALPARP